MCLLWCAQDIASEAGITAMPTFIVSGPCAAITADHARGSKGSVQLPVQLSCNYVWCFTSVCVCVCVCVCLLAASQLYKGGQKVETFCGAAKDKLKALVEANAV